MESIPEKYLQALVEISHNINSIQNPDELLESILSIGLEQLSAERGFILLKDENDPDSLLPRAVRNIDDDKIADAKEISLSTIAKVQKTMQPILSFDTLSDENFDPTRSIMVNRIRSIACAPLVYKKELLGVIYIDSQNEKARLTRQSLAFLQAFANQAAIALQNARLMSQLQEENALLKEEFHRIFAFKEIIGKSKAMDRVFQMMGKVLNNDATVLITGPTGSGKELIARAIHFNGHRKEKAFVPVNCGAIPENLIESELFGHKKGAFTGAVQDKKGLIETAHGGTLFLDEIGELPLNTQVKLLRFLQDRRFAPVGEVKSRLADVRIITATNRDLQQAIQEGHFREDLFYRINVIHIQAPPLEERRKDIPLLVRHFLKKAAKRFHQDQPSITPEALAALTDYHWPGNVRELENTIERAVVLDSDHKIDVDDLVLPKPADNTNTISAGMTLEQISQLLTEKTLKATEGNKTKTAGMMGVSLRWIHYKLKEWGMTE
ncbi:MAG: GAF domain-containing protein [Actinobacteria bacterium]|nr:GAF domain-containing protein [Actinomycetota bacterium]